MPQPQVPAFPDETGCSLRPAAGKAALSQTAECHAAAPAAAHPARSPVTRKNSSPGLCRGSLNFPTLGYDASDGPSLASLGPAYPAATTGRLKTRQVAAETTRATTNPTQ